MAVVNARTVSASPHADAGTNKDVMAPAAAAATTISHADDLPPVAAAVVNIPDDSIVKDVTAPLAPDTAATPSPSISINKKKHGPISKYQEWWPEILVLKKKKRVVLELCGKVIDPDSKESVPDGMAIICICCRDYKGKSDGVISLRSPYNEYYWKSHIAGKKHITLLIL